MASAMPACRAFAVIVRPDDYFELIARQTSGLTQNIADDELTWFAIEVVERENHRLEFSLQSRPRRQPRSPVG